MSPWVSLKGDTGSYTFNTHSDIISARSWAHYGSQALDKVMPQDLHYIDAAKVPDGWFSGVNNIVDKVLISVGEKECLRDDVVDFGSKFAEVHGDVSLVVQRGGVHDDPYFDFAAGLKESQYGELTPVIITWLMHVFRK